MEYGITIIRREKFAGILATGLIKDTLLAHAADSLPNVKAKAAKRGIAMLKASEAEIQEMISENIANDYESARSEDQQLTFEFVSDAFSKRRLDFEPEQQRALRLIDEDGSYTNLARLMSEQCPSLIKVAIFKGTGKAILSDSREFNGSLLSQLEEAYGYIDSFNKFRSRVRNSDSQDKRDYPDGAVREALTNALLHMNYGMASSAMVNIFDDRIEIVAIGGLLEGLSIGDVMLGVSVLRNPSLADIMSRLDLVEALATGMERITGSYQRFTVKPTFENSENAFRITLPKLEVSLVLEKREEDVIALLEQSGPMTRKQIQVALAVSQATTVNVLRSLLDKELVCKEVVGKKPIYKPCTAE